MFKKILCAVDFSDFTDEILQYAMNIAHTYGSELHLIHVIPTFNLFTPYESFVAPDNLMMMEKNIEIEVQKDFDKILAKIDIPVKKVVKSGLIFIEIINYVNAESIELVVMGTHGRSAIEHILIGSVAEKVVRKSPCPVLTIRPREKTFKMP